VAEVSAFSNLISLLTGVDAFTLLFPFLLAWMLYYAMIDKSSIFDDTELSNAPPIVAMILAFFTARFLVMQPFYQTFFSDFFGKIVIGLASILGLFTLLGMSGMEVSGNDDLNDYVKFIAAAMAGAAFIWAGGFGPAIFGTGDVAEVITGIINYTVSSGLIWLLVIGGAVAIVMVPEAGGGGDGDAGG